MTAHTEPIMISATSGVSVLCIQVAICFRLPFELWSLIFDHVFADLRDAFQDFVRSRAITSRVCAMWRAVIIGTPSLWSRLDIGAATSCDWVSVVLCSALQKSPHFRPPRYSV
ncbi:hypothetical protein C8J57DRAFT_1524027 [Mycena rebaudengoi]|nr:hypothetical protein C8J57DRAFT_1524027 [Mycena rebaudengoi]